MVVVGGPTGESRAGTGMSRGGGARSKEGPAGNRAVLSSFLASSWLNFTSRRSCSNVAFHSSH